MLLIYLSLAWVVGIIFAEITSEINIPFGLITIFFALLLLWWRDQKLWRVVFACGLFFGLGGIRLNVAQPDQSPEHIANLNNEGWVTVEGVVVAEPDVRDTVVNLRVEAEQVNWLGKAQQTEGIVLVQAAPDVLYEYGDRVLVTGQLHPPPELDTFSYRDKLARQGIFSQMWAQRIRIIGEDEGEAWRAALIDVKDEAQESIEDALSEPQASLLSGILLGDESGLSPDVKEAFNETGTSHVIAISGFNMALIAGIINAIVAAIIPKRRGWTVAITLAILAVYTLFVGANPAVVRAAFMSGLLVFSKVIHRRAYVPASLAFAALIMSLLDPWVLWDIGFQLSFAAVLGMALLTPSFDRNFRRTLQNSLGEQWGRPLARWLSEPIVVTLVAQIATLPIILYYFGRLSVVSPLVNFLIIPVQAPLLVFGGLATLLSFVIPPLGMLLYQADWLFLTWTTELVRAFADLPVASVEFQLPASILIAFAMGAIVLTILTATRPPWYERWWKGLQQNSWRYLRYAPILAAIILLGAMVPRILNQPDEQLHVIYLNMGQSNSAVIRTPGGAVYLIDGGRFPSRLETALGDLLPPDKRQIDVLFLSSDARDDIGALVEIVDDYEVGVVITNVEESTRPEYVSLIDKLRQKDVPIMPAEKDYRVQSEDGVTIRLVAPVADEVDELVLRLEYGEAVFLFTSSLSLSQEETLLLEPHLVQANVLQVADHGEEGSNSQQWINHVNPQVAIIQNDPSRSEGIPQHVLEQFGDRKVFRTDIHGRIEITSDGQTLSIQTE